VRRGERRGDRFVITTSTTKKERSVTPPKRTLLLARKLDDWLRAVPKKDAVFESWSITFDETDIDTKEEYTFKAKKTLTIGGVPTDVFHVIAKSKGAISDTEMRSDGTPLRSTLGGFLDVRSEPEAVAKKLEAAKLDLLQLASIPWTETWATPREWKR